MAEEDYVCDSSEVFLSIVYGETISVQNHGLGILNPLVFKIFRLLGVLEN